MTVTFESNHNASLMIEIKNTYGEDIDSIPKEIKDNLRFRGLLTFCPECGKEILKE